MKREKIAPAVIQYFPLDQLHLSDLNPRQDAEPEGIDLLADSLAMIGLVQNLSGLADAETGKIGIVAGGLRLRAIARAIERDPAVSSASPPLRKFPFRSHSTQRRPALGPAPKTLPVRTWTLPTKSGPMVG